MVPPGLLLKSSHGSSAVLHAGAFDEEALCPGAGAGALAAGHFCCQILGSIALGQPFPLLCCPAHLSGLEELIISHSEAELARTTPKKTDNPVWNRDFLPCCSSGYVQVSCWALLASAADHRVCSQGLDCALL